MHLFFTRPSKMSFTMQSMNSLFLRHTYKHTDGDVIWEGRRFNLREWIVASFLPPIKLKHSIWLEQYLMMALQTWGWKSVWCLKRHSLWRESDTWRTSDDEEQVMLENHLMIEEHLMLEKLLIMAEHLIMEEHYIFEDIRWWKIV